MSEILTIVPAAGHSRRFRDSPVPKQFRRFVVAPGAVSAMMWENALYGLRTPARVLLGMREDHNDFYYGPRRLAETVMLKDSRGQAHTILQVLSFVQHMTIRANIAEEVLVVNCDNGFAPGVLDRLIATGRYQKKPAAMVFRAGPDEEKRWSYVSDCPWFQYAAEKMAISSYALAGAYYFPNAADLKKSLERMFHSSDYEHREPYLSGVYTHLESEKIACEMRRDDWYDWGTPEALQRYTAGPMRIERVE